MTTKLPITKLTQSFFSSVDVSFSKCYFEDFMQKDEIEELKEKEKGFILKILSKLEQDSSGNVSVTSDWINSIIHSIKNHARNSHNLLNKEKE